MTTSIATAKRAPRSDGYGRYTRFYEVPGGGKYPSVTAVLGAINKPALVPWAAKMEREAVIKAAADLYEDLPAMSPKMSKMAYLATLDKRIGKEKAHSKALSKAGDIGSEAHGLIEWNLRRELQQAVGPEPKISDKALWAFMAYEDWRKQSNLAPLLIEQTVWSDRYGYAGTMDWYGEIDHESIRARSIGDFKTGKAIYGEAVLQVAAYAHALVEMGHADPEIYGCIVRLPKTETDPDFEVKVISPDDMRSAFKVFLHTLDLWQWLDNQK